MKLPLTVLATLLGIICLQSCRKPPECAREEKFLPSAYRQLLPYEPGQTIRFLRSRAGSPVDTISFSVVEKERVLYEGNWREEPFFKFARCGEFLGELHRIRMAGTGLLFPMEVRISPQDPLNDTFQNSIVLQYGDAMAGISAASAAAADLNTTLEGFNINMLSGDTLMWHYTRSVGITGIYYSKTKETLTKIQ